MNKPTQILLAIIGACSVLMDIMTPLLISLIVGSLFVVNRSLLIGWVLLGGFASVFRAIKVGWWKKDE